MQRLVLTALVLALGAIPRSAEAAYPEAGAWP